MTHEGMTSSTVLRPVMHAHNETFGLGFNLSHPVRSAALCNEITLLTEKMELDLEWDATLMHESPPWMEGTARACLS